MNKKEILSELLKILESNIEHLNDASDTINTQIDLDEEGTIDPDDLSRQSEAEAIGSTVENSITIAENNYNQVKQYLDSVSESVEPGALVETGSAYYLIGISLPKTTVSGKPLLGISTDAPAYASIAGKKNGDTMLLGDQTHTILAIG